MKVKLAWLALVAAGVAGALSIPVAGASQEHTKTVVVKGHKRWKLPELGASELRLPTNGKVGRRSVPLGFPPDAFQPRHPAPGALSYLIHMDVALKVSRTSGSGVAVISGITNGCPSAQINVHVRRRRGRPPIISWNSTELIHGVRGRQIKHGTFRVQFSNYLPFCGVKPGKTQLLFVVQNIGQIELERAVVLPTSGIEVSDVYRSQLALRPEQPEQAVEVGEKFRVGFTLENIGDAPAHDVGIEIRMQGGRLRAVGPRTMKIGDLVGRKSGKFEVVGKRSGEFKLELQVFAGNSNQPAAVMRGDIVPRGAGQSGLPGAWLTLLWLAAVSACGVLFLKLWRRRTG
jgi:hypothetical protein